MDTSSEIADDKTLDSSIAELDGRVAARRINTSVLFLFSQALHMQLTGERATTKDWVFAALRDNAMRVVDIALQPSRKFTDLDMATVAAVGCAVNAPTALAPDRLILARLAETCLARFPAYPESGGIPELVESRLLFGAYSALLAQDLTLLRRILNLQSELPSAPSQWALLRDIAASSIVDDGFLRCRSADVQSSFIGLFQTQRVPYSQQAESMRGGEPWFFGRLCGSYVYAWIYLQSFGPSPQAKSDWDTLRHFLIG